MAPKRKAKTDEKSNITSSAAKKIKREQPKRDGNATVAKGVKTKLRSPRKTRIKREHESKENARHATASSDDGDHATDDDVMSSDDDTRGSTLADKMRANRHDNAKFFAELGIASVKEQVAAVGDVKLPSRPSTKGYKEKREKEILPPRKSLRLQNITPEGVQLPEKEPTKYFSYEPVRSERVEGCVDMSDVFKNDSGDGSHDSFLRALTHLEAPKSAIKTTPELSKFLKEVNKMQITEQRVAKVTKDRIFSVAIHPSEEKVLAFAGDKWGKIGFWDVRSADNQDGVFCYAPHCRPVKQMTIRPEQPERLYSCSYDGQLRCCFFELGIYDEVYSTDEREDMLLTGFDFRDDTTMLVSQWDGYVGLLDIRQRNAWPTKATVYHISRKHTRSVSFHPADRNYFATAHQDGNVMLWDLRMMSRKNNKALQTLALSRVVESAYFSPVTGKYLLTTGLDNKLRIFNSENVSAANLTLKKAITHDNWTGRWLSKFRAVWHPTREDVFIVGSMVRPRQIEMFSDDGVLVKTFKDAEWLGSVCSANAFHPTKNILVGGNSSGRLHVFM